MGVLLGTMQDFCIILSIMVQGLMICNTFVFQAGLLQVVLRTFGPSLLFSVSYLALSILLHLLHTVVSWNGSNCVQHDWLFAVYVLQRFAAVCHYYLHKRTALFLAQPKYYGQSEWLQRHVFVFT
ncbi:transmembrane protein 138-like isoform X2 [Ornithodoros turicata]|uniref:transmembrane protein 138-like isoform X2 n=1 Tax=Ornithodoros turicata TaxID=34597 RepID=UPI003139C1FC